MIMRRSAAGRDPSGTKGCLPGNIDKQAVALVRQLFCAEAVFVQFGVHAGGSHLSSFWRSVTARV